VRPISGRAGAAPTLEPLRILPAGSVHCIGGLYPDRRTLQLAADSPVKRDAEEEDQHNSEDARHDRRNNSEPNARRRIMAQNPRADGTYCEWEHQLEPLEAVDVSRREPDEDEVERAPEYEPGHAAAERDKAEPQAELRTCNGCARVFEGHNVRPISGRAGTEPRSTDGNYTAG